MRDVVRERFVEYSAPLEGEVQWFYNDIKGLVTIGIGNLVDPFPPYLYGLPFVNPDGSEADADAIRRAWGAVKKDPNAARYGHRYAKTIPGNEIRLTEEGVKNLVGSRLDANDAILKRRFPEFEDWNACAQMAVHSLAWACGAGFNFPRLQASLLKKDFEQASVHIFINETGNPGLKPRNLRNHTLMLNAGYIQGAGLDPDTLDWDSVLGL